MKSIEAQKDITKVIVADASLLLVAIMWGAGIPVSALLARSVTPVWAVDLRMIASAVCLVIMYPKKNYTG